VLRLRGTVAVAPLDLELVQAAAARTIERWRDVHVDGDGVVDPTTGEVRAGLQVADGTHPREGVVYRVFGPPLDPPAVVAEGATTPAPAPASPVDWRVSTVELVADRPRRVEVSVDQTGSPGLRAHGEVGPRDRPGRGSASVDVDLDGPWPARGRLRIEATGSIDPTAVPTPSSATGAGEVARAEVSVRHPRGRARGEVTLRAVDAGRWEVEVAAQARGRGLLRPVAAVALALARRSVVRSFDEGLAKIPDQVAQQARYLVAPDGSARTPDDLAAELVTDLVRSVPAAVPDEVQRRRR